MKLTNYVIKRKIQQLAKEGARKHNFHSLEDVRDVLIFFHLRDKEEVDVCIQLLRDKGKKVESCMFIPLKAKEEGSEGYITVSAKKDLDIWGIPSNVICKQVIGLKADIIIDLTGPKCYALKYLTLLHPADFKVGLKRDEGGDIYDFSIAVTNETEITYLFKQILFYLQTIRSK